MKYGMYLNQIGLIKISKETGVNFDLKDAVILQWIYEWVSSSYPEKIIIDGSVYAWATYKTIMKDLPLIGIKTHNTLRARLDKYVYCGLVNKFIDVNNGSKLYLSTTSKYEKYIIRKSIDFEDNSCVEETTGPCSDNDTPPVGTTTPPLSAPLQTPCRHHYRPPCRLNDRHILVILYILILVLVKQVYIIIKKKKYIKKKK